MVPLQPRFSFGVILLIIGFATATAQTSATRESSTAARDPRSASASRTGKGLLPDPALLDGSALEPEKRPEHGMLGEFEMAGDENAKSDKVGGESNQPPSNGGSASATDPKDQNAKSGGGASAEAAAQAAAGGAAAPANPAQSGGAGSNQPGLPNDPNAKAQGMQVGELKSDGAGGTSGEAPPTGAKPQQVALGDSAMQIKPQAAPPGVVGAQQLPQGKEAPQAYDTKTPSGGKQSGSGRGNQGVEKGRVMPTGI